jgi:hypothetical protein
MLMTLRGITMSGGMATDIRIIWQEMRFRSVPRLLLLPMFMTHW